MSTRPPLNLARETSVIPILLAFDRNGMDVGWHQQAACVGLGDAMFPTMRDGRSVDYRDALLICHGNATTPGCPVMSECLEWALEAGETDGVWGGATPHQRRRITERRAAS